MHIRPLFPATTATDAALVYDTNAKVADIIAGALSQLRALRLDDLETPCMAPGWDWPSIDKTLADMMPKADDPVERRAVAAMVGVGS